MIVMPHPVNAPREMLTGRAVDFPCAARTLARTRHSLRFVALTMRLSLRSLPGFRRLFKPSHEERRRHAAQEAQRRVQQELYLLQLLQTPRYADPRHLAHFEAQVFSQNGEDGIISEILRRIGTTDRFFVEIGAGHGIEANTAYLLRKGWKGVWLEADPRAVRSIQSQFAAELASGQLRLLHSFVTRENAPELLSAARVPNEIDVMSIDVDRNTSHVWRSLSAFRPRVLVIEYNAAIPASDEWEIPYDADAVWDESSYFGASLKSLESIGAERGYVLVACERTGLNAFFVRADAAASHFPGPLSAEACYEPPRYFLTREWGHPRRWVEERLQRRRTWASASE